MSVVDAELIKRVASRVTELTPPLEIAKRLDVSTVAVIQYLFIAIGDGLIKESELFFILDKKYASEAYLLEAASSHPKKKLRLLCESIVKDQAPGEDYDVEELMLYTSYRKRRVYIGDMYLLLTELERLLHENIKRTLMKKFGEKESGWWKMGVPDTVRIDCARAREFDEESVDHPYHFTNFIHLKRILDKNWSLFFTKLPQSVSKDKTSFLKDLVRLNGLRNQIMHPVREQPPTEQDFEFLRQLYQQLDASLWR